MQVNSLLFSLLRKLLSLVMHSLWDMFTTKVFNLFWLLSNCNVKELINSFKLMNSLIRLIEKWENCIDVPVDGAPATWGRVRGFSAFARERNLNIEVNHCMMIHRHALLVKHLELEL